MRTTSVDKNNLPRMLYESKRLYSALLQLLQIPVIEEVILAEYRIAFMIRPRMVEILAQCWGIFTPEDDPFRTHFLALLVRIE